MTSCAIIEDGRTIDHHELDKAVSGYARLLASAGAGRAGRVAWMLRNRAEALVVALAARRIGAPIVAFGYRSTTEEIAGRIQVAAPVAIIVDSTTHMLMTEVAGDIPVFDVDEPELVPGDGEALSGSGIAPGRAVPNRLGAGASLLFTSGTSGAPKAALRTSGDPELAAAIADGFGIGPGTRFLVGGPLYHSGPWTCALMTLARGGVVGIRSAFDPVDWLRFAGEYRMNSGFLTPTQLRRLVVAAGAADVPELNHVIVSGEPFPDELKRRVLEVFGPGFVECYGCTELGPLTALHASEFATRQGSSGRAFPGVEIAAFDGDRRLGTGEIGTLRARTPMAFDGYVEAGTSPSSPPDRWATVHDAGFVDTDGHVHLVGRADDMIISAGVNVFPADVESVLGGHPDVVDCAVFGLPDERFGQTVAAAVVSTRDIAVTELRDWLRGRISDEKRPYHVFRLDSLPVTSTGKVSRNSLRASFAACKAG